jgi:hypothetical protein
MMNKSTCVLFFALALPTFGAMTGLGADPQPANASWDNLKTLRTGQEIRVVLNDAKSYQGELQSLNDGGITLRQAAGEQTLARQDILRVSSKGKKRRGRNALIGAAIGAGAGLGIGAGVDHSGKNCGKTPGSLGPCFNNLGKEVLTPVGALAGAVVGAVMPAGGWHDVYRAR